MIIIICILSILLCLSTLLLVRTTQKSLVLLDRLEQLDEQLENAVVALDDKRRKFDAKSKLEVFFDDPVVKDVVKDISECRDIIAQIMQNFEENSSTNQNDNIK